MIALAAEMLLEVLSAVYCRRGKSRMHEDHFRHAQCISLCHPKNRTFANMKVFREVGTVGCACCVELCVARLMRVRVGGCDGRVREKKARRGSRGQAG